MYDMYKCTYICIYVHIHSCLQPARHYLLQNDFAFHSILQCYQIKVQSCDNTNGISTDLIQYQMNDALIKCFWLMLFNRQYICFAAEKIRIRKSTTQLPRATYISLYVFGSTSVFARKVIYLYLALYREQGKFLCLQHCSRYEITNIN